MPDEAGGGARMLEGAGAWRRMIYAGAGVAGLALLLAAESLGASQIFDLTLRYPGIDKVAHVLQYALVLLAVWWLLEPIVSRRAHRALVAAGVALLLGMGDELFQRLVADRSFELADLAANLCGVLLGLGLGSIVGSKRVARSLVAVALIGAAIVTVTTHRRLRYFNQGILYSRQGDLPKALAQYRLALADGLDSPGFFNELAWIEVESGVGDAAAAVRYAAKALEARPDDPDVLDTYGWALHHAGRSREARAPLEAAFAGKPRMFCIHYHLGEVYATLGETARAEAHLRDQIRLFPGGREAVRAAASLGRLSR